MIGEPAVIIKTSDADYLLTAWGIAPNGLRSVICSTYGTAWSIAGFVARMRRPRFACSILVRRTSLAEQSILLDPIHPRPRTLR